MSIKGRLVSLKLSDKVMTAIKALDDALDEEGALADGSIGNDSTASLIGVLILSKHGCDFRVSTAATMPFVGGRFAQLSADVVERMRDTTKLFEKVFSPDYDVTKGYGEAPGASIH